MKETKTVVGKDGHVMIPGPIRALLGLQQGDTVAFVVRDGRVELFRVDTFPPKGKGSADDLRHASLEKITRGGFEPPPIVGA